MPPSHIEPFFGDVNVRHTACTLLDGLVQWWRCFEIDMNAVVIELSIDRAKKEIELFKTGVDQDGKCQGIGEFFRRNRQGPCERTTIFRRLKERNGLSFQFFHFGDGYSECWILNQTTTNGGSEERIDASRLDWYGLREKVDVLDN